ncbi:MAG: Alkaline phosphatase precursor [Verrucomicrobiota bacterium]
MMNVVRILLCFTLYVLPCVQGGKPIQLFVLAGDECVLEEGVVAAEGKPGTLEEIIKAEPRYAMLKDADGRWISRNDVMLYDAHPIHNNTEAPAKPLDVSRLVKVGGEGGPRMGVDLMLGHVLGDAIEEPVLIHRYAVRDPVWFKRGSRDLDHNYRPPSSGGNPDLAGSWDVIHFNFGVWDATYREPTSKYYSGHRTTSVEDFETNLRTLVAKMKKTGATLIWGSVTPVWEGEAGKPNGDEDAYNRVAAKVMKENGVIINDLNAYSRSMGFPKTNDVHSVGVLSPQVTKTILEALAGRKQSTKPLPRVLLIGDSITGSYQGQVFKDLDGKAAVFKNPGNGEDTWNGLERMDEWLDLGKYLMNGQEYLELVDSIRKTLGAELSRIDAAHADRGVELAGIFWFQGIHDGMWNSKAVAYESHLANLIRDLRKEFNQPRLPVVVAALAGADTLNPNPKMVFDAQMAVGNPLKYPEFRDTVRSIDTLPMSYPAKECPGGRDPYKGHAGSYLRIGEAMAKAMLGLRKQ